MKIYVITVGDYSDYHICAVTDDPVSAENLKKLYSNWEDARIEEYDTRSMKEEPPYYWSISIDFNGQVEDCEKIHVDVDNNGTFPVMNEVKLNIFNFSIDVSGVDNRDSFHALKIAYDKIAEYKYYHMKDFEDAKNELDKLRQSTLKFPVMSSSTVTILQQ